MASPVPWDKSIGCHEELWIWSTHVDHANTLLDGIADSAARVTARHRVRVV